MSENMTLEESAIVHDHSDFVPPGYQRTDAGIIPQDWSVSTVGTEFAIQLGKMLDAAKNSGIAKPYIGNRAVQWGRVDLHAIAMVPMLPSDLQRFRLQRDDLLVCEGGEIGRSALWDEPIPECYYQKALHRLRAKHGYDVFLMMCLLQLWTTGGHLANYVTQTSIAHLPKDKFESVPLPVPPLAEQRAIAAALSDVHRLVEGLESLIEKKRAIKQATMQLPESMRRLRIHISRFCRRSWRRGSGFSSNKGKTAAQAWLLRLSDTRAATRSGQPPGMADELRLHGEGRLVRLQRDSEREEDGSKH